MDLEDVRYYGFDSPFFYPWEDFSMWRLHSKELRDIYDHDHDDPMIPDDPYEAHSETKRLCIGDWVWRKKSMGTLDFVSSMA